MNSAYRYGVFLVSFLCLTLSVSNSAVFNFSVICMTAGSVSGVSNGTAETSSLSAYDQSILFGMLSIGRIVGSYPTLKVMELIGFKTTFVLSGILSGLVTMLVPILGGGFYPLALYRLIQGFSIAANFIAFGTVPNDCGKEKERNMFLSTLTSSLQLGPVLIMPIAGVFCSSSFGWHGSFYLTSLITLAVFSIFYFTYTTLDEIEAKNQKVVDSLEFEERTSESNKSTLSKTDDIFQAGVMTFTEESPTEKVPYKAILLTPSFWGIVIVAFGDTIGYHMFLLYGPIYINKVLGYNVTQTGLLAAVPYLFSILTKVLGGHFLDKATCIKENLRIVFFTCISQAAMTVCFVVLTQITPNMAFIGQSMFTLMMVFSGLAFIGLMNGSRIISQQYSHISTSALSIQDSLAALTMPALVALIAPNYDRDEWTIVFYVIIGLLIITNVSFVAMTKVKPAEWTKPKIIDKST
ncbi:hypothetical protein L596_029163 [Steinernema carpocapsae]|uniref:Major facilitator superfamily (MFS) profile domain-containing protein n=1 Tax=Steinernema carpocapsae TaxID=34508 RepID=A0A4U5LTU0_STECR|nr:hypothetical protein L596_029163 [Steinernema carpocapsae]